MPLLRRMRVLAAKAEATPGTAETLAVADGAFNVYDVIPQATIGMTDRMGQGSFGHLAAIPEGHGGTVNFRCDLAGDGAGGVPAWASTFLPACGWVANLQKFDPKTEPPGANVKTLTIGVFENGLYKQLRGAAGTFVLNLPTGRAAYLDFTFTGVWDTPTDVAVLGPTYPTVKPFRAHTSSFVIGSWTPCIENMTFNAGNNVILRECTTDRSGYLSGLVSDRLITGTLNPESTTVADQDSYGTWLNAGEQAFTYEMENAVDKLTLSGLKLQFTNIQEGNRNENQIDDITYQLNGDDLSIIFAAGGGGGLLFTGGGDDAEGT